VVREQDADLASGDLRGEEGAVERHLRVVKAETSHGSQAIQSDASYKSSNADGFTVTWTAIQSGSAVPQRDKVGKVSREQVREIAQLKMPDLNAASVESAMRMIEGTARSMGLQVVD